MRRFAGSEGQNTLLILGSVTLLVWACDDALGPAPSRWRWLATVPAYFADVRGLTATAAGVYAVAELITAGGTKNVILFYDGGAFYEEYELPYRPGTAALMDIKFSKPESKFGKGFGWAVGGRWDTSDGGSGVKPIILVKKENSWDELNLGGTGLGWINKVFPVDGDTAWLLSYNGMHIGGALYKYDKGAVRKYALSPFVLAAYAPEIDTLYVYRRTGEKTNDLFITSDGGETWVKEQVLFPLPPGYSREDIRCIAACGEDVFFVSDLSGTGGCIHRRSGPAGRGRYELSFLSNWAPNFTNINDLAANVGKTILAVGDKTSAFYDGSTWLREEPPYPITFTRVTPCPGGAGGFFAVGHNEVLPNRTELLFHP